jgi:hypothetical protein
MGREWPGGIYRQVQRGPATWIRKVLASTAPPPHERPVAGAGQEQRPRGQYARHVSSPATSAAVFPAACRCGLFVNLDLIQHQSQQRDLIARNLDQRASTASIVQEQVVGELILRHPTD